MTTAVCRCGLQLVFRFFCRVRGLVEASQAYPLIPRVYYGSPKKIEELNPHALEFLQTIPGISEQSAVQILIELGGEDMTPFKTADRLASWIGVCPGNNESAGKRKHGHIRKGNYYLRRILCECATAAVRTKGTTFQSKYNALKIRKGYKRSLIAIVHKMVLCIFCVLSRGGRISGSQN